MAIAAGRKLSERLFNGQKDLKQNYDNVPTVMFTHPPIGSCGLTENDAIKKYGEQNVKTYTSSFNDMYYAMFEMDDKVATFMKIVTTGVDEKIVGLHCIGKGSGKMIQTFLLH